MKNVCKGSQKAPEAQMAHRPISFKAIKSQFYCLILLPNFYVNPIRTQKPMEYQPQSIEQKWQQYWQAQQIYHTPNHSDKPKYYVLDMFPYPSGAGLHVGHPLGYIASDIVARYKRMQGFNVLHPMGFDSFGLPAEQYAIDTGQHPAITTAQNIATFKQQLGKIGFSYDWSREVQTSAPQYYRWTQWIFQQIFDSWYDLNAQKARPISELVQIFEVEGNHGVKAACDEDTPLFSASDWKGYDAQKQYTLLLHYRLTYLAESVVNWCPALGTVLANDEVKDGFSERGGHPVERKKMKQWSMRITAYAERLLNDLERLDWSEALKEMQRNWIGKSYGCEVQFEVPALGHALTAFTTRIDTIYGVSYLVLAPEHEVIDQLATPERRAEVEAYVQMAKNRSERERQTEVKTVSGAFTGAYAINPFNGQQIPIWVADYVLAGYGTGVVMGVPASDERDFRFATHFGLPIVPIIDKTPVDESGKVLEVYSEKSGRMINSDFLNGLEVPEAIQRAIAFVEEKNIGKAKVNYRLRDAVFSRQRYWGEPVPVYFKEGLPYLIPQDQLPLTLPDIEAYKPTEDGEPPLARAEGWKYQGQYPYELTTMPGWAGSSWYFLRYMDSQNDQTFAERSATDYWNSVDLYIGGTEHAVGHLLYSRFWAKFLFDRGYIGFEEPFQKLLNQGMIQGVSALVHKLKDENTFVSFPLQTDAETIPVRVDISLVDAHDKLDTAAFKQWRPEYQNAKFIPDANGQLGCERVVEKMSKSKYNVVNPDEVIAKYGADTLRLYEMFLGPIELSKPWNTQGIDGVSKFLRKLWRLFYNEQDEWQLSDAAPSAEEWKVLHKTIKKVSEDIERLSFNTPVSAFMIAVNELNTLKCHKQAILEPFLQLLAPYAPHITEELWAKMGHIQSIHIAPFPIWDEQYLAEDSFEYPVSINGKMRTKLSLPLDLSPAEIEQRALADETVRRWMADKAPKKVIVVPKKIINVVV